MMNILAIDCETTKKPRHYPWIAGAQLSVVSVARSDLSTRSWVFNHEEVPFVTKTKQEEMVQEIKDEISLADMVCAHNLKFDLLWLKTLGLNLFNKKTWCTMLGDYLVQGQRKVGYSLDMISRRLGIPQKKDLVKMYWEAGLETMEIPLNILRPYCEQDCVNALALCTVEYTRLQSRGSLPLAGVLNEALKEFTEIEWNGMKVNRPAADKILKEYQEKLAIIDTDLKMVFGFDCNLNSGDQLSAALFGGKVKRDTTETYTVTLKSGEVKEKTRKAVAEDTVKGVGFKPIGKLEKPGYFPTGKPVITQLVAKTQKQMKVKELLLERSNVGRVIETFVGINEDKGLLNLIMPDGCIHPNYNLAVTSTGRPSSSNPNGQNLPRKGTSPIKQIIIPRFDGIMVADASQAEWRACAFLSQDLVMQQEITSGVDVHLDNAIRFFGDAKHRQTAKIFTFRMLYGGTAYSFFADPAMPYFTREQWEDIVYNFYKKYAGLKKWQDENIRKVYETGELINPTGRLFNFVKVVKKGVANYRDQQIKNYPVQSLATGDIMPVAMVQVGKAMRKRKMKSIMIGQVHDSMVFDYHEDEKVALAKLCLNVFTSLQTTLSGYFSINFNVPLAGEVECGPNYADTKPLKLEEQA